MDSCGDIFIADTSDNRVREINHRHRPDHHRGRQRVLRGTTATASRPPPQCSTSPRGVALDGAGDLYIADSSNHRVREVNLATGLITTIAGNGTNGGSGDGGAATAAEI